MEEIRHVEVENKALEKYMAHFSPTLSDEITAYAIDEVLLESRYIFTYRYNGEKFGYCTHCNKFFVLASWIKHNMAITCPDCSSKCVVKDGGRKRTRLKDEAYFVFYEKSVINPNVITARGIHVVRDYTGDYKSVKTDYDEVTRYIFDLNGESVQMVRRAHYSYSGSTNQSTWKWAWEKRDKIISCYGIYGIQYLANKRCSIQSIRAAVKDTPFQHSTWEQYQEISADLISFFNLFSKYPCIEYVSKLGFGGLVEAKLTGYKMFSVINWRGKSMEKVLKMSKQDIGVLKSSKIKVTPMFMKIYQIQKADKSELKIPEVAKLSEKYKDIYDILTKVLRFTNLRKADNYISKTLKRQPEHYETPKSVLIIWKDYLEDCISLDLDLQNEVVLFPRDLYEAHQSTLNLVDVKIAQDSQEKILKRAAELHKKYFLEHNGLLIRPAGSVDEIINEGKRLDHCVRKYASAYKEGKTDILFIRKDSEPYTPFFTVEVQNGRVMQVYGKKHSLPSPEVKEFMEEFKKERLEKKPRLKKTA